MSNGVEGLVIEVQEVMLPANPRKSTMTKHTPTWLKESVSLNIYTEVKYPVSNYISYSHFSPTYQCPTAISSVKKPATYLEAVQDQRWVDTL